MSMTTIAPERTFIRRFWIKLTYLGLRVWVAATSEMAFGVMRSVAGRPVIVGLSTARDRPGVDVWELP
jgi:hypothetical protein